MLEVRREEGQEFLELEVDVLGLLQLDEVVLDLILERFRQLDRDHCGTDHVNEVLESVLLLAHRAHCCCDRAEDEGHEQRANDDRKDVEDALVQVAWCHLVADDEQEGVIKHHLVLVITAEIVKGGLLVVEVLGRHPRIFFLHKQVMDASDPVHNQY